eukprot:4690307-Alexandrium_andersonii.AAC.1
MAERAQDVDALVQRHPHAEAVRVLGGRRDEGRDAHQAGPRNLDRRQGIAELDGVHQHGGAA